jgi:DNA polymerase-3 subunit gamma/tau
VQPTASASAETTPEVSGPPDWARDAGDDPETTPPPASGSETTPTAAAPSGDPDSDAHRDDPDDENSGLAGAELLERELGAEVIEEIRHS